MPDRDATVVIVTKDRRDDALQAVESALGQKPPVEVVVVDDGSQDGTADAVADAFPEVRVERREQSAGLVVRRNETARLASAPVIVSIDDAIFTDTAVVANAVAAFDDPRVAAVAIPYVDVPQGERVLQAAPDGGGVYVTHRFRGTAHALRKDVFVELGGYRAVLFQQAEEPDCDRRPVSREPWRLYERLGRRSARIEEIETALSKERS
jgi:glycosyltransferase involved in cell wall biosynthesis